MAKLATFRRALKVRFSKLIYRGKYIFQKLLYIMHGVYPLGKKITLRECGEENRCFHSDTDHSDDSCRDVVENPLGPLIECRYVRILCSQ